MCAFWQGPLVTGYYLYLVKNPIPNRHPFSNWCNYSHLAAMGEFHIYAFVYIRISIKVLVLKHHGGLHTVFPRINAPPRMNAPRINAPPKISDFKINAPPRINAPLRIKAPSQKSEKITVYSSLTQDQILINFYNTGITAYTSRKMKTN